MIEFQKNNASLSFSEAVLKGDKGDPGVTPNIQIGTVETLPAETPATASMTGTPENPLLNLGIPRGKDGGGGASDFIIKMTVESDADGNYTITSCDATVEQIDAAVAAEKRVVVIASYDGSIIELPMLQGAQGDFYSFGTFFGGQVISSSVYKGIEGGSHWDFWANLISAGAVSYYNNALSNISTVEEALDELVTKSHTHANKAALDKLSTDTANSTNLYINGRANQIALEPKIFNYASYTSTTLNLTNNCYYILKQVHKLTINPPSTPTVAADVIWITFADEGDIELAFPTTVKYIGKIPTVNNGETWEITIINKVVSIQKVGEGV